MTAKRFLSVPEVAELLGVSTKTVYRLVREQKFPAIKLATRVVIPSAVIDAMEATVVVEAERIAAAVPEL